MCAMHLVLIGVLALFLGAASGCGGGKGATPPPPLNKSLLTGKWKNNAENQWVDSYEFAGDGTVKIALNGLKQALPCKYAWSGDRNFEVEYPAAEADRQAYKEAAKAYKDRFVERVKAKQISDRALLSLTLIPEELPAKETLSVAISEAPVVLLILTDDRGTSVTFNKMD